MEADRVIDVLFAAFESDPLYRWLYPDPTSRPAALRENLELVLDLARERGEVDVDREGRGVAVWTAPGVELLEDPTSFIEMLDRWAPERRDAALTGMEACSRFGRPDEWVLHLLAVHPDHQNAGVGARLVEPRLRRFDEVGVDAYLESSSARNVGFYRRCGFEVLAEVDVPDGGPTMRPMRRRHGASTGT